jgi:predicted metal-dependent phosphoesterase TrpH
VYKSVAHRTKEYLKVDLHTHSAGDPKEKIQHTSYELIDRAYHLGYDALSITNHEAVTYTECMRDYARERGIVLIPGVELKICGKHVLAVNAHEALLEARTFDDLRRLRTPENLIVAPHPYFPDFSSLLWMVGRNIDVFDALEFSWFFHSRINFNMFAMRTAARHGIPLVCTSDCHHLMKFGVAYSRVDAEKDADAIIDAVKAGRVEIAANPLKLVDFSKHGMRHIYANTVGALMHRLAGDSR